MFGMGFNSSKLKLQLKLAQSRIQMDANKRKALMAQNMREIALLLSEEMPNEENARIRVESIIRDDNLLEAYEILKLECELLVGRIKLIELSNTCPPDLVSSISTLIYAAPLVNIQELTLIRKQFRAKYGKKFKDSAQDNINELHRKRVVAKLSLEAPSAYLAQTYLERICERHEVDWEPTIRLTDEQTTEQTGASKGLLEPVVTGLSNLDEAVTFHNMDEKKDPYASSSPFVTATAVTIIPSSEDSSTNLPPPVPPPERQ